MNIHLYQVYGTRYNVYRHLAISSPGVAIQSRKVTRVREISWAVLEWMLLLKIYCKLYFSVSIQYNSYGLYVQVRVVRVCIIVCFHVPSIPEGQQKQC